jgi:hypothetical protein
MQIVACRSAIVASLLAPALGGCAPDGPVVYPVRGRVTIDGRPLADAFVVLHLLKGDVPGDQRPLAYTDADGRFAMTTFRPADGAPPGDYALTVELRAPRTVGEEVVRDGPNLLPARYSRPETSGLRCTVTTAENELPVIELKRP